MSTYSVTATENDQAHQNGYAPIDITPPAQIIKARVEFGTKDPGHQSMPHEWAAWIYTEMRNEELAGKKPRPFSAWLSAACLHFAGMDGQ